MSTVRAKSTVALAVHVWGRTVVLAEGELRDSDDPVVVQHPDAFEPADAPLDAPVEVATAVPGVKRSTKRPARKNAAPAPAPK